MLLKRYLVISGRGDMRVVTRKPHLAFDEVAFPLNVNVPKTWGHIYESATIDIAMPDPPAPVVSVEPPELPEGNGS